VVHVLLVATYELGRQPTSLATTAARLRAEGCTVTTIDTSVEPWDPALAEEADEVWFSVPMHTATRLARELAAGVEAPKRFFGLYAAMCADLGAVDTSESLTVVPARDTLPPLDRYAALMIDGGQRTVGSVDASYGCAHRCRHCPVPVVFDGRVKRVDEDAVLADVAQLVALGAQHITFGDPDFLNAPPHSLRVVRAMHERFPQLTFDCTVKVEHVLRHAELWPEMAELGCVFVVSAFESVDDAVLERLDKGHTAADAGRATALIRDAGIAVRPSFLPFTPWTTREDLVALLDFVHEHDLAGSVDPVQYTIRLLLPAGSLLLGHPDLAPYLDGWDDAALSYRWRSADPAIDVLQRELAALVEARLEAGDDELAIYAAVRATVDAPPVDLGGATTGLPRLTESWFCCAEPTEVQLRAISAPR
jgi:Radical SAM superfamily